MFTNEALFFVIVMWSSAPCGTEWRSCNPGQGAAALLAPPTPAPRPAPATASGHAVSPLVLFSAQYYIDNKDRQHFSNKTSPSKLEGDLRVVIGQLH